MIAMYIKGANLNLLLPSHFLEAVIACALAIFLIAVIIKEESYSSYPSMPAQALDPIDFKLLDNMKSALPIIPLVHKAVIDPNTGQSSGRY